MNILTMRKLASVVTLAEGGKSESKIHDVRQHVAKISDLVFKKPDQMFALLYLNGQRRAWRKRCKRGHK